MEALALQPNLRDRIAPWIEGGLLALLVLVVVTLGGDAVRISYHGYLHTSLGEAVLRGGLMPENPYHAGTLLHYYTFYPTLGVLLGRLGMGPLWGFAVLNIFAAMLMGPALDAFGKRLGLDWSARRFAFAAMIFGFNGFAWWWGHSAEPMAEGSMPLLVLLDFTRPLQSLHWDGRLQAFLPKFLNVSSFALSLPFALFAMAENLGDKKLELQRCGILLGLTTAINPLVGGFVGILVTFEKLPLLLLGWPGIRRILPAVMAALLLSVPFLLPLLIPSSTHGGSLVGHFPFQGVGAWANLLGPLIILWILGGWGCRGVAKKHRRTLVYALILAALFSFLSLPWSNEYKFPRLEGILLAIPAGVFLAQAWRDWRGKIWICALGLLCFPTLWVSTQAYASWDGGDGRILDHVEGGRLALSDQARLSTWPKKIELAEKSLPAETVLVMHPWHPGVRGSGIGAQGHQLMPILHHALFVDSPQIHNSGLADLRIRLDESFAFWEGRRWPEKPQKKTESMDASQALLAMRRRIAPRPLAVITLSNHLLSTHQLETSGAEELAEENGVALWLLAPLEEAGGN